MKRTILAVMAVAAMLLSSCAKDYSADIENLQKDVDALKAKVETIESAVKAGVVVTDVAKTDNGIVVKMNDGKEYEITNGTDGAAGSVVAVNAAGNWTIDGVDTGLAASGTNGDYYKPCTDKQSANFGKWIKVDGTTGAETVTDSEWKTTDESSSASGLTAVWEDDVLMLYGVKGYEDDYYEISFTSVLRAFCVYPTSWSSTYGLPYVTSYYMINETIAVTVLCGNLNSPRLKNFNWQGGIEEFGYSRADYSGFGRWLFGIAYASYLGAMNLKDDPDYNPKFDANSPEFEWQWTKEEIGLADPADIYEGVMNLADYITECLDIVESNTYIDFVPSTPISLTYRVVPMGASLDGYKFSILEHGINVTKVGDEKRDNAFVIDGKPRYKKDELVVDATTSYFKAMSCTPLEFIRNYIKYDRYSDEIEEIKGINDYVNDVAEKYLDTLGLSQAIMVNLEASTNGRGSEAIVSDGCIVKFEQFNPYIYFKDAKYNYVPLAATGAPGATVLNDAVDTLSTTIDLGSKLALRDPVRGNAENYGFEVQWEFSIPAEYASLASVSSAGVVTRLGDGPSGAVVPVVVSAHVMTPANGKFIVANEGVYYVALE